MKHIIIKLETYKYHIFIFLNLLWVWALLSPNVYYFDDTYRAIDGLYAWGGDFRPFADWLYYLLGMGWRFTDLTPLPQILALCALYLTYYLYIDKFSQNNNKFIYLLIFSPMILSPFLLANLYFRYDSVFMLLAVFLSSLAAFYAEKSKYVLAIILMFISLGLYQPSMVGYIAFTLFLIYKLEIQNKNNIEILKIWTIKSFRLLVVFILSLLFYYVLVIKMTTDYNFYSSTHTKMSVNNFMPNIVEVLKEISILFNSDTGKLYFIVFLYLLILNFLYFINRFKCYGLLYFIIINVAFVCAIANVNLLLEVPRFEYRTYIIYGFYLSFLLYSSYLFLDNKKLNQYIYPIIGFICLYFLSIALNMSNFQKEKKSLETIFLYQLANDLYDLEFSEELDYYSYGTIETNKMSQMAFKYPIIEKLSDDSNFYLRKLRNLYNFPIKSPKYMTRGETDKNTLIKISKANLIVDKKFYKIYRSFDQSEVFIEFKLK